MGRKATTITLTPEERSYLELQTRSRTIQAQTVCRARILLLKADGEPIDVIADKVGINRCSVMLCLKKFRRAALKMPSLMLPAVAAMLKSQIPKRRGLLTLHVRNL